MGYFTAFEEKSALELEEKRCGGVELRRVKATPRLVARE
jgi:hypothetical protein